MHDDDGVLIGDLLNRLGVTFHPVVGDSVEEAIVIMRVVQDDGVEKLSVQHSGVSWLMRVGMLRQAELLDSNPCGYSGDDDD